MSYSVYAYPWNLSADNYQQRVDEILSLGLQGMNLAVSYHAGKFIHPRGGNHRVYFPEDGVVYFRPRAKYGRIKPVPSLLLEREDILEYVTKTDGMVLNAWTVLFHNTRLGMQYPETTVRNAFGDGYVYSLCPAHPDVREFALTLCKDLTRNYPITDLLLETPGYLAYCHGYHHEFAQVPPDSWLEAWLGLCFCDHCIVGAGRVGIDGLALQGEVVATIDDYLGSDELPHNKTAVTWFENDVNANEQLKAFLQWRCDVVTSLVKDIRAQVRPEVKIKIITTTQQSHRTSVLEGHDLPALHHVANGLELPLYQPSVKDTETEGKLVIQEVGGAERLSAILRPGWPDMNSQGQVTDTIARVQALGIRDLSFYNYDMLRQVNLKWLKNALMRKREID